jgi:hypothetical protein
MGSRESDSDGSDLRRENLQTCEPENREPENPGPYALETSNATLPTRSVSDGASVVGCSTRRSLR